MKHSVLNGKDTSVNRANYNEISKVQEQLSITDLVDLTFECSKPNDFYSFL